MSGPADPPTPDDVREDAASARARADAKAPGLREQIGATREALMGLVRAHVDLAKAELDEIKGEVARAAALGAAAIGCLLVIGVLLPIGGILFLGEWIFGSMGWGLLHGTLLLLAIAVAAGLSALRVGIGRPLVVAVLIGAVASIVLGAALTNRLWTVIGEATGLGVDPAIRPLVVALIAGAVIGAVGGALAGWRAGASGQGLIGAVIAGVIAGLLVGALTAISFTPRVGVALGVAIGLAAWIGLMAAAVGRDGVDTEALKARFWPQATIDTAKETIEWAKARSPLGPRS